MYGLWAKRDKFLNGKIFIETKFFSSFVLKLWCPGPAAIFTEKTPRRPVFLIVESSEISTKPWRMTRAVSVAVKQCERPTIFRIKEAASKIGLQPNWGSPTRRLHLSPETARTRINLSWKSREPFNQIPRLPIASKKSGINGEVCRWITRKFCRQSSWMEHHTESNLQKVPTRRPKDQRRVTKEESIVIICFPERQLPGWSVNPECSLFPSIKSCSINGVFYTSAQCAIDFHF